MSCKDRGHKKGIADDISAHCVNQAALRIMTVTMQNSVKKGEVAEVGWQCCVHTQIFVDDDGSSLMSILPEKLLI
jgi:hypothetical protein